MDPYVDEDGSSTDEGDLSDGELQRRFVAGKLRGGVKRRRLGQQGGGPEGKPESTIDKAGIEAKMGDFAVSKKLPWLETFLLSHPLEADLDPDDDFKREDAFYQSALQSVFVAEKKLAQQSIPVTRPPDYFAEMVKTDAQMKRIRQRLLDDKQSLEASEKAKKQRELKKFGKKVQRDVLERRRREKKSALEAISRQRKGLNNQLEGEDQFDVTAEQPQKSGDKGAGASRSVKRKRKDAKYGYGGKNNKTKANSAESSADLSGFNWRENRAPFKGQGAARTSRRKGKPVRPGKQRRKQMLSMKK